jgi:hypothetical protein
MSNERAGDLWVAELYARFCELTSAGSGRNGPSGRPCRLALANEFQELLQLEAQGPVGEAGGPQLGHLLGVQLVVIAHFSPDLLHKRFTGAASVPGSGSWFYAARHVPRVPSDTGRVPLAFEPQGEDLEWSEFQLDDAVCDRDLFALAFQQVA